METWLILGILAYLSYAISTSIDKYMMNIKYDVIQTSTFKMLFDGLILVFIGFMFYSINLTSDVFVLSLILGIIYAIGNLIYYNLLKITDVEEATPSCHSLEILLIFIFSIILFNEIVNLFNYLGIFLILIGVYFVLSKTGLSVPKIDKSFMFILSIVTVNIIYWLLVKKILFSIRPIDLAIPMYFSTALVLFLYQLVSKKNIIQNINKFKNNLPIVMVAAFFGALGTLLVYSAVSLANASKVYPLAGLHSIFIFIIASFLLKEKFYFHRLIGIITVVMGIFLISI